MPRTRLGAFALILLACAGTFGGPWASRAAAQDAYACIDGLTDDEVRHRLAYLERSFARGKRHARWYWYGWTAIGVGATAFTWTLFGMRRGDERNDRDPPFIMGVGATVLLGQMLALPFWPAFAPQRIARMPEALPEERREKLRRVTRLLEQSARREGNLRGIATHIGATSYAIAGGTYLAVRYDKWATTMQAFLVPPLLGEARLFSIPQHAYYDWERYRLWACQVPVPALPEEEVEHSAPHVEESALAWSIVPAPGGLGLRIEF